MHILSTLGKGRTGHDFTLIESPVDPDWFWGTFMIMHHPPMSGDVTSWEQRWNHELPQYTHRSFCWNRTDGFAGAIHEFLAAGYERFDSVTLECRNLRGEIAATEGLHIRPLESDADWKSVIALQSLVDKEKYVGGRGNYKLIQMQNFRKRIQLGAGQWWGAFLHGELVGDTGLFHGGRNRARLQLVETHPAHRRAGVCTALTRTVTAHAMQNGFDRVIAVAEAGHPAERLYRDAGFVEVERTVEVWRG